MTPAEFKTKWAKVSAKESAAYQSHFDDLCRLLNVPPPLEADPKGEFFCFQKRVVKDEELFVVKETGEAEEEDVHERGFADVWKRGCFAWEYKGKKKNLDDAYRSSKGQVNGGLQREWSTVTRPPSNPSPRNPKNRGAREKREDERF